MKQLFLALALLCAPVLAHDTWVETNTSVFRVGDRAHIDLKLGNHGNDHRDFKLASKVALPKAKIEVLAPSGARVDLKRRLIDTGYTAKEGFWTTTFIAKQPGIHTVFHQFDDVMSYAPERAVKTAKTFFLVSKRLDKVPRNAPGFARKWSDALELVPETNPVAPMAPGRAFKLRLWWKNRPLPGVKVSFIPQGETLRGAFDSRYEAVTNINGRVQFTPRRGGRFLCVAHHRTNEKGRNAAGRAFDFTKYGATLTLFVPQISP